MIINLKKLIIREQLSFCANLRFVQFKKMITFRCSKFLCKYPKKEAIFYHKPRNQFTLSVTFDITVAEVYKWIVYKSQSCSLVARRSSRPLEARAAERREDDVGVQPTRGW